MPTTADKQLREQLTSLRAAISAARDQRAVAQRHRDKTRDDLATAKLDLNSGTVSQHPTYKAATKALEDLRAAEAKLEDLRSAEHGLLEMLSERTPAPDPSGNGPHDGAHADSGEAGGWLARVLSAAGGGTFGRGAMAVAQPLTTDAIGSVDATDRMFFRRLERRSALLASGIQVVDIDTTSIKVGEITGEMAPAVPTAETDPIPKDDVPLDDREITPPKFPKLVTLSKEAFDDARPIRVAAVEGKMLQAIGLGFDAAGFHGGSSSLHPGLANTTGIAAVTATDGTTGWDWAADAVGDLLSASGEPRLLFLSPFTVRTLLKLREDATNGTGQYLINRLQDAASDLLGVPVRVTRGVNDGEAFMVDPRTLLIVRRQDVETEVFPGYDVDHAIVAVRAMMRAQLVVVDPAGVVHITGLPTPAP